MRERPTVVMLHPGPGFDHGLLQGSARPVARRAGAGRLSRPAWAAGAATYVRPRSFGFRAGRTTSGAVRRARDRAAGRAGARVRGARRPRVRGTAPGSSRWAHSRRSGGEDDAGGVDRDLRAPRRQHRPGGRGALLRVDGRPGVRRLPPRVLPAPVRLRALDRRHRARRVDARGADRVDARRGARLDLRDRIGAVRAPTLVLAGEDDAWAPDRGHPRAVERLPPDTLFHAFPGARHSVFQDAPAAYEVLDAFLAGSAATALRRRPRAVRAGCSARRATRRRGCCTTRCPGSRRRGRASACGARLRTARGAPPSRGASAR